MQREEKKWEDQGLGQGHLQDQGPNPFQGRLQGHLLENPLPDVDGTIAEAGQGNVSRIVIIVLLILWAFSILLYMILQLCLLVYSLMIHSPE